MVINGYDKKFQYLTKYPEIGLEIINFILGDLIGEGCYRDVYNYNLDDRYVVKIASTFDATCNSVEWRIWNEIKYRKDDSKNWFAPCIFMSVNGRVLIQRKTQPLYSKEKLIPEKIPAYFTDIKEANFGWIGNRLVAHDYSHCLEKFSSIAINNRTQDFKKTVEFKLGK